MSKRNFLRGRAPIPCIGTLAPYIDGFSALLDELGYSEYTKWQKRCLVAKTSIWLEETGLGLSDFTDATVERLLKSWRHDWSFQGGGVKTLRTLVEYLASTGAIVPRQREEIDETEIERLLYAFGRYLSKERALSASALRIYLPVARRFLHEQFGVKCGSICLGEIKSDDVSGFVSRHARDNGAGSARLMVTSLRSFFRFLRLRGDISVDLAASVLAVADWRLAGLPKFISPEEVERVLAGCDRRKAIGRRDYAILLLLSRLGLRAGEVSGLMLDDIDWVAGEITVRRKGGRHQRLPLPPDVGEALVAYLRGGRPVCNCRRLFIRAQAPREGFASGSTIATVVREALNRADLHPPRRGAHLLRHSVATRMLREGATLSEIGELLGHRRPDTTAIYAKVDTQALRNLAQPWPGSAR